MTTRRVVIGALVAAALVLSLGRWASEQYTDSLWYAALGASDIWRARFVDEICGGIPNDPEIIKSWLRSKTGIEDGEEIKRMMARSLAETQGLDWENQPITEEVLDDMIARVEDQKHMCVFKRDPKGQIYIENR